MHIFHPCPILKGCICDTANKNISHDSNKDHLRLLMMEMRWSRLSPRVFCICLADREDRLQQASSQFHKTGLCRIVLFGRPERPTELEMERANVKCRGMYGCWRSHRSIAELSLRYGWSRVMIFEDDILFKELDVTQLEKIGNAMDYLPQKWEMFMLGLAPMWGIPISQNVFRVGALTTHAYLFSTKGAAKLVRNDYTSVASRQGETDLDQWYRANMKQYAWFPQIAVQSGSLSSNDGNGTEWYRENAVPLALRLYRDWTFKIEIFVYAGVPILSIGVLMWVLIKRSFFSLIALLIILFLILKVCIGW